MHDDPRHALRRTSHRETHPKYASGLTEVIWGRSDDGPSLSDAKRWVRRVRVWGGRVHRRTTG